MKANAPEKLYLLSNGLISYCRNNENDIEYIRTDAFIEEACDWLRYNNNLIDGNVDDYVDDFKNYMKGG